MDDAPEQVTFTCLSWRELDRDALYEMLALRQAVFVVEQSCVYLDCDGKDARASHLLGRRANGELVAYARLFGPGIVFREASIGRVLTHASARREGLGRTLMREAIACVSAEYGAGPIRIGAQRYLERFYAGLGFVVAGDPYIEDGIPHVEMLRS